MADVKLVVDVDYSPSLSNFQSNISRIVNQINGNPLKIKLRVDAGSFKNDIAQITNQLKALSNLKINPFGSGVSGGGGGASSPKNFVADTLAYIKEMDRLVNLQKSIQSSMTKYSGYSGDATHGGTYNTLAEQLGKVKSIMDSLDGKSMESVAKETAQIKLEADKASAALAKVSEEAKKVGSVKVVESGSAAYFNDLKKINNLYDEISRNAEKWKDASKGSTSGAYGEYTKQLGELEALSNDLKSGTLSAEDFKRRFAEIGETASRTGNEIKNAFSGMSQPAGNMFSGLTQQMLSFVSTTRLVMAAIRTMKQMISYSIEIESAMNRIQIVTGATDAQMGAFFETAAAQARELGASITDVAGSIETFSRLG